jgi:hypothetical protein
MKMFMEEEVLKTAIVLTAKEVERTADGLGLCGEEKMEYIAENVGETIKTFIKGYKAGENVINQYLLFGEVNDVNE